MPSHPNLGSEGEFVDSFSKANLNNHPHRTTIDAPSRDRHKGYERSNGGRRGYRSRRDRHDESPPPFRHSRDSTDRSPSPYRRPRDRSPSPYRQPLKNSHDRSPSPYRRGRDNRNDDQSKTQGYKRKGSPPHNTRPEKRYYSAEHRHKQSKSNELEDHAEHAQSRLRGGHGKDTEPSSGFTAYADHEYTNPVPDFNSMNQTRGSGDKRTSNVASRAEVRGKLMHTADTKSVQDADQEETLVVPQSEDKAPSEETREEKRRRWALKKAQYAAQRDANAITASPLLQQALLGNLTENNNTPDVGSPASPSALSEGFPSPSLDSPFKTEGDSVPASPDVMVVEKQQIRSAEASPLAEEMSATKYNMNASMDDDRVRAFQQAHQTNSPAASVEEQTTAPKQKQKEVEKDFDMFADDIDVDDEGEQQEHGGAAEGVVLDKKLLGNWTDKDDYYKLIINELIGPAHRYMIVKFLGKGVFANVARAIDTTSTAKNLVAIKITRKNDMMRKSAQRELKFLRMLNEEDPQDKRHILRVIDSFDHKGHFCILFEHLDRNLRDLLKDVTKGHGLAFSAVKTYARQIFSGLYHLEHCKIIHFDLKPDNILVSQDLKTIKICDFGTAEDTRDNYDLSEYVVSRFYRSPEIVLGMPFTYAIDMWAIGCTLYELWTGKILFTGASNNQMIRAFMECLGWPSEKLLKKGDRSGVHFEQGPPLQFLSYEVDPFNINKMVIRKIEKHRMTLKDIKTRVMAGAQGLTGNAPKPAELNDFAELLAACLNWNFEKRIKPKDALNHKVFINKSLMPRPVVSKPVIPKRSFGSRK